MRVPPAIIVPLLVAFASPAWADEGPSAPYFLLEGAKEVDALPLKASRARFTVAGVIARVRLSQVYENHAGRPLEAVYVFPVSTRAAVHGMRLRIGDRVIEAEIEKKATAKKTYAKAKAAGKQAGLLEQARANVLQMRVANIRPGDRIEVDVDYSELVVPTDGTYELVIPSVVGPRFTGEGAKRDAWAENPHLPRGEAAYTWHVGGEVFGGLPIAALRSPSHTLSPRWASATRVGVEVEDEAGGDRDFVLRYRLGGDQMQSGLLLFPGEEEQFFLLQVAPPKRVAAAQVVPREYVFVVDVSGSMAGFPLLTAKRLLARLVNGLRPEDRFNVVLFAGGSEVMSARSVAASAENIAFAERVIDGMRGGGGTHLLSALRRAFALPRDEGRSTSFVVITDGYVNVAPEAAKLVRDHLDDANLFTFGIGSSVNRDLVERLARAGMGEPFVVLDPEEAPEKAKAFQRYIEQPVLTDVRVEFDGFDAYDVEPEAVPDLFASRPVTVFGKYRGQPAGRIGVRGVAGAGTFFEALSAHDAEASDDLSALAHLWARHRVARLEDEDALSGDTSNRGTITTLGLRHSLLTAYTSFVAVDSQSVLHIERATEVRQALPTPKGLSGALGLGGGGRAMFGSGGLGEEIRGGLGALGTGSGGGGLAMKSIGVGALQPSESAEDGLLQPGAPIVMGSLDKDVIRRVVQRHGRGFRRAYERGLRANPQLAGKVMLKFTIRADGRVQDVEIISSTLNDAAVEKDILHIAKRMRFPKPTGGGIVVVRYPLIFRSR